MKRLLTIMTALALAMAMVTPAGAKGKPDKPPKPDPPAETPACEFDASGTLGWYDGSEFVPYEGGGYMCVWTVTELPSTWEVTIHPNTTARNMMISVRDENPGDFCAYEFVPGRSSAPVSTGEFLLPQADGDSQCDLNGQQQYGVGEPTEFYLLIGAKVSGNNTATVTATQSV